MLGFIPDATILHLGIFREKKTMQPVEYYNKLPERCQVDTAYVLDPMIATGGTAIAAIDILKEWGVRRVKVIAAVGSTSGMRAITKAHPDVHIVVGAEDAVLDSSGWIVPGLGDIGDRMFGTGY